MVDIDCRTFGRSNGEIGRSGLISRTQERQRACLESRLVIYLGNMDTSIHHDWMTVPPVEPVRPWPFHDADMLDSVSLEYRAVAKTCNHLI
jgi:hypothetical protein